ncbi:MAG: hypothetical protein MI799_15490, partial [Desulfobacterales bacterium]|nr:hypothetical protein [Desulfobacterales bacterium]
MEQPTESQTGSRTFPPGYPDFDEHVTGQWQCMPLQQGLQVQTIDINPSRNLPVMFNRNEPHMEFGCLFSGKLHGSLKTDNGREQYFTNEPGQLWCSFSTRARGCVEFLPGSPVYSVSFIVHGALLRNILTMKGVFPGNLIHNNAPRDFNTLRSLTPEIKQTAGLVTQALKRDDAPQHLFLISKAYELLSHIFRSGKNE